MVVSQKTTVSNNGIGFCGLLTIVFIVLKLTGFISWSWWMVTSPLWAPAAIVIACIVVGFLFALLFSTFAEWRASKRRTQRYKK